ncbi:hypothetical protein NDU88_007287 [Pleurodeles waltl]|uniref:ribonuclease H n=1 Tax=Pleurodeles waltl TaxID=8319 RepID=A0AAV7VS66_PLEWA|nr:hypothetical protein NDU88_007287 [Pleurodeles waltl]
MLPCSRVYALSEPENQYLQDYLDDLSAKGLICHSTSPVPSSLFFVPKKNHDLRSCIDYHAANKVTIKNRYPFLLIPLLLDQVRQSTIYTKLDLWGAYHLIRVMKGDEWKTAFQTKFGLFEYTVMPFGLCNAPAAFQFFINEVLQEFLDICVVLYIDDILIYLSSTEEHIGHVRAVLQWLREHHLCPKLEKCVFHATTVGFLGNVITSNGISMDRPKGIKFPWDAEAEKAFQRLKNKFTEALILHHPDLAQPFFVEADAFQMAVGGVLSQRDPESGHFHPVAYFSKKLLPTEKNYTVVERELLVIKLAFQEWRQHLPGARYTITIYTDHHNLQFFQATKALTPRQLHWLLFFNEFDFVITYRPGTTQQKADTLSRMGFSADVALEQVRSIIPPEKIIAVCTSQEFLEKIRVAQHKVPCSTDVHEKEGLLYHADQLYVPAKELRDTMLHWGHDSVLAGHPGVSVEFYTIYWLGEAMGLRTIPGNPRPQFMLHVLLKNSISCTLPNPAL